jgi:hypothetical protein
MWMQRPPFWIFSAPQQLPHTTVDIPTKFHEVWWKESKIILNPPFYVSMAAAAKFVQPNPIFFGLSRSTSCGCCSYQVSSISVQRVNCYDHFCVFQFFSILAVSMTTAAILIKKINPYQHNFTWHMIFLQGFIKFDQGISEKSSRQKCVGE